MRCPFCNMLEGSLLESRPTQDGLFVRKHFRCFFCEKEYATAEIIAAPEPEAETFSQVKD
jgi:transcriptional repressor NrdR